MNENNIISNIVQLAFKNKDNLKTAKQAGCYFCIKTFNPNIITKWTDKEETALCPFCETDCVVPNLINTDILKKAHIFWFKK